MDDEERVYFSLMLLVLVLRILLTISSAYRERPNAKVIDEILFECNDRDEDFDDRDGSKHALLNDDRVLRALNEKLNKVCHRMERTKKDSNDERGEEERMTKEAREAKFALYAKNGRMPKMKRLIVSFTFLAFAISLSVFWWFLVSPLRDRTYARNVEGVDLRALENAREDVLRTVGDVKVLVYVRYVAKRGAVSMGVAENIRNRYVHAMEKYRMNHRRKKKDDDVRVSFRACVDVVDADGFMKRAKSAEEAKMFTVCDKGQSELARRARFYARSTMKTTSSDRSLDVVYAHLDEEMGMNFASYANEIYAFVFDDEDSYSNDDDGEVNNFQLHFGTERNAFVEAKWTSEKWSSNDDLLQTLSATVEKVYASALSVSKVDAKFDGQFGTSAMSLSFALVIPEEEEEEEEEEETSSSFSSSLSKVWNFRDDVRQPYITNISKRLEHFMRVEADSRVIYSTANKTTLDNSKDLESFTRTLPLRAMDNDAIQSHPSGKFIVYKNDGDMGLVAKNWFVKRAKAGITIWDNDNIPDLLPFLLANVRARLLGIDVTSDEAYTKIVTPDTKNVFSMFEVDALASTRVVADALETIEILRGSVSFGDIDSLSVSKLASQLRESYATLLEATKENAKSANKIVQRSLITKARKIAFQASRSKSNVRDDGTFPPEHELALGMPLILPLSVAFFVKFSKELVHYSSRKLCAESTITARRRLKSQ